MGARRDDVSTVTLHEEMGNPAACLHTNITFSFFPSGLCAVIRLRDLRGKSSHRVHRPVHGGAQSVFCREEPPADQSGEDVW